MTSRLLWSKNPSLRLIQHGNNHTKNLFVAFVHLRALFGCYVFMLDSEVPIPFYKAHCSQPVRGNFGRSFSILSKLITPSSSHLTGA